VAVANDPLLSVASAVMVAPTLPLLEAQSLTTPPFSVPLPGGGVSLLLVTGK
jgi:hypothetical protein